MYSKHILFEEIIEGVKDDTGIENLSNLYPKIRRLIYRCEQDIGFGNSLILKLKKYSTAAGTIVNSRIKLPENIVQIESFGMCQEGICPGDYRIQGNYLFFCKPVSEFSFIYYTILCDGEGNPMVTQNHKEAVISGLSYYMYKPRVYNGNDGSVSYLKTLEKYYHDRIGEARGDDAMPSTKEEWSHIANQLKMSHSQTLIYNLEKKSYCNISECESIDNNNEIFTQSIYYWQFDNLETKIDFASSINQTFLDQQKFAPVDYFLEGNIIDYTNIGRIGFAINNTLENEFSIYDMLNNNITDVVFDKYFNTETNTQIYISKEYYTYSNMFFKIIKN